MKTPTFTVLALMGLATAQNLTLGSPDIAAGSSIKNGFVFNSFGCSGQNVWPALIWSGIPANAKSLALIVHDRYASTGVGGFTHWIVYDIPLSA